MAAHKTVFQEALKGIRNEMIFSFRNTMVISYLLALFFLVDTGNGQISRVSQFYPNAGTAVPYNFAFPVSNGFFLPDFTTYVHGDTAGASASIYALRKDASQIQVTANNALTSYSLNFYNDYMVSFGSTASIIKYQFLYTFPGFFTLSATDSVAHGLGLFMAIVDKGSGMHYVSTLTAKNLYKYADATLTTPAATQNFPDINQIGVLRLMRDTTLIIAGTNSLVKFLDKTSLSQTMSYTTTCSGAALIAGVLYDTVHVPQTEMFVDLACDMSLTKFEFASGTLSQVEQLGPYAAAITNLLEFPGHNYLMVTYSTTIEIVKRSSYLASQGFQQLTLATVNAQAIACCEFNTHRFTFTTASGTAPVAFKSLTVNLDFCSNYDGQTCTECNSGYKLNSSDVGNSCITPDEYPPRFGAKGSLIAECQDANCLQCIDAYYKCEDCKAPYYINMESFECSDLNNITLFGKDLTNSKVIRRCSDSNCLYCKDDYTVCTLCQEEYFFHKGGVCIAKDDKLTVVKTWFNESESKGYVQFSAGFSADPLKVFPTNLTMKLLDNQGEEYTDFTDFSISGDKGTGLLVISIQLHTSIYDGQMIFNQTAKSPVFYNTLSYMVQTAEFNITNIRQIRSSLYFSIEQLESVILVAFYPAMILSAIIGSFYHPLFGTLMMKSVCLLNFMSHLDGPALHASDLFMDIAGRISLPIKVLQDTLRTPEKDLECQPADSFTKRYGGYSSCNIFDMYGKSILFFVFGLMIGVPITIATFVKLKALRQKMKDDLKTPIEPSLPKLMVLNKWFGSRFILGIMYATAPITLQYSVLSGVSSGSPIFALVFGAVVGILFLIIVFCAYRFSYLLLDFLHILDLKKSEKRDNTNESPLNDGIEKQQKGHNIIYPKKLDTVPTTTKNGKIVIPSSTEPKKMADDLKNTSTLLENSGLDNSLLPLTSQDGNKRQLKIDLEVMRNKYGFIYFFVLFFKTKASSSRVFFYYLPVVDMLGIFVNCYVLVRFSGDGLVQVYVISVFEFLTSFIYTLSKPYELRIQYVVMLVHRSLVGLILLFKMFNFIIMPEEAARQKIIDTVMLALAVFLLIYATTVSLFTTYKGLRLLCSFKKLADYEELILEEERLELKEKLAMEKPEKPKPPSIDSQSISGISDSPARRDLPKDFLAVDKIARANKLTLKNREKINADNLKLQNDTIKEEPEAEEKEFKLVDAKERGPPIVETLEITKKSTGIFTTVDVSPEKKIIISENRVAPKPLISVAEGSFLKPTIAFAGSKPEGNPFQSRLSPNVSISQPKKVDKFAAMLENSKQELEKDSRIY